MKIYVYKWENGLICINFLFKVWRKPYKYLNRLFLPQLPSHVNWFSRIFKNIEVSFHSTALCEKGIKNGIEQNWFKLIKVI